MNYGELKAKIDVKKKAQCTVPIDPGGNNAGNGTISQPVVADGAVAETWTIALTSATAYTVTGGESDLQDNAGTVGAAYITDDGLVTFTVTAGGTPFESGDDFTFIVSEDGEGLVDATIIRKIEFEIHSQVDDVAVGYDAENNAVRVIQVD